jgi:hypothetical protein
MTAHPLDVIWGMTAMASLGVAVVFARFWKTTRDRFFALFALAFTALAGNWLGLALAEPREEGTHLFYLFRLVGFVLIIVAVIDKNRRPGG